MNRTVLLSLLFLVLLLAGASCGGGAGIAQLDSAKDVQGITEGGFNLVRYNDEGTATNALNPTLDLNVQPAADTTTVTIAIDDKQPALGVTLDLRYDTSKFTPMDVEFDGLIDTEVELAVTRLGGLVAIGQVSTDGADVRSGQFATITFRNEPNRSVSAAGDAHDLPINTQYSANGFTADGFTVVGNAGAVDYNILGIFTSRSGDGDQNGASNIGDLTPLGAMLNKAVAPNDAVSARADYDGNGLPNISDLTPLGANLGEITTGIELLAGDSDPPTTVVATLDWVADGDPPVSPSTVTADPSDVWRQFNGSIDATTADGIDADDDDHIFISARAITSGVGADGAAFTPAIDVTLGGVIPSDFVVTDLVFQVDGTTISDGATLNLEANDNINLEVTSFTGTYNGTPFTGGDVGGTVPQAEYDAELASIQADADYAQVLNPGGFAGFQSDKTAVLLNIVKTAGVPAQADTATVFPDDDPGNTAEGSLAVSFSNSNNNVADMTVTLDVDPDPDAPLLDDVRGGVGQDVNGNWPITSTSPDIRGHLTFPGGDPFPIDGTTVGVELVDLTNNAVLPITFTYTPTPPTAAGTFTLQPAVTGFDFTVRVPAGALSESNLYMVRFFDKSTPAQPNGSSVNKPGEFVTGGPVAVGVNSKVLPSASIFWGDDTKIAIIMEDPFIRRNPQVDINGVDGTVTPTYGGFADILKNSGDEFPVATISGASYPQAVIVAGNDPSVILATDVPSGGIIQEETGVARIVVDILALPEPLVATTYAYKVFGAPVITGDLSSRPVVTSGTFVINPGPGINNSPIVGIDFGINAYDGAGEGDLPLGAEDFSTKTLRISSLPATFGVAGNDTDVLFVQFNGGEVAPMNSGTGGDPDGYTGGSNRLTLHNDLGPSFSKTIDVRVAGVGVSSLDYIGIVHYTVADDVGPSGLVSGLDYEVRLNDPTDGTNFTFGAAGPFLTVVN